MRFIPVPDPEAVRDWTMDVLLKRYNAKIAAIADMIRQEAEKGKVSIVVQCDSSTVARDIIRIMKSAGYRANLTLFKDTDVVISW